MFGDVSLFSGKIVVIRIVPCIITLIMIIRGVQIVTNAREARQNFSLNNISTTKHAFRLCIETLSIARQTYMPRSKIQSFTW